MDNRNNRSRELIEDIELRAQDAVQIAGGDAKPTPAQKPDANVVFNLNDVTITSYGMP